MKLANLFRKSQRDGALRVLFLCLPALGLVEGLRLAWGEEFNWLGLLYRWGFIAAVLLVARTGQPYHVSGSRWIWPWPAGISLVLGIGAAAISLVYHSTVAVWVWLGTYFVVLLQLSGVFRAVKSRFRRWPMYLLLGLYAGMLPVAIGQLQGRFSDEEFFVAVQAFAVGLFWLFLQLPYRGLGRRQARDSVHIVGLALSLRSMAVGIALVGGATGLITLYGYQLSFYASTASLYEHITPDTPFLCGETAATTTTESGVTVFNRLLAAVADNPRKGPPEYGMLALGTGEERWAQAFRESLLQEAAAERFSQAANSVKSIQYEAAKRAYYLPRVREAFPRLFSEAEQSTLTNWFGAINRRALTVEWVDWMYAVALARWPRGPYENQENGAGLLAVLISGGLEDPKLSQCKPHVSPTESAWLVGPVSQHG